MAEPEMDFTIRRGTSIVPDFARATARPGEPDPLIVDAPEGEGRVAATFPACCDVSPKDLEPLMNEDNLTRLPPFPVSLLMTWLDTDLHVEK